MFYEYIQNNSGGVFDIQRDKGIGQYVFIEADTAEEANQKALDIGLYFNGVAEDKDCECCGDRWYEATWGHEEPPARVRQHPLQDWQYPIAVHYADGHFSWVEKGMVK